MKYKLNPLFKAASGQLGDLVFYELNGQPVSRRKGVFTDRRSQRQLAHRDRVKQAAKWAKATTADPKQKAEYRAACQGHQTPYNVAVRDFLTAPQVRGIDLGGYTGKQGEKLLIQAWDDFEVTEVSVALRNAEGHLIEEGPAEAVAGKGDWIYTAKTGVAGGQSVQVEVTAVDRPGNATVASRWQHLPAR